jgi:transcriptional/translational regulatory protein YebC/TACO1
MTLAAQEQKSVDPALNSKLNSLIQEALKKKMPMQTIQNVLKRCKESPTQLVKQHLECKFLGKIFLVAEYYVDNLQLLKNSYHTVLRKEKQSQNVSVRATFEEMGIVQVLVPDDQSKTDEEFLEKMTEVAIEIDAHDVDEADLKSKSVIFTCDPGHIDRVRHNVTKLGYSIEHSEHVFIPRSTVTLSDDEKKQYDALKKRLVMIDGYEKIYDNVMESE